MQVTGTFEITSTAEPPYDEEDGVTLGRWTFHKRFTGPLDATSTVHMLGARTPVAGSAGYVAMERVRGTLDGRAGSFVLQHSGTMGSGGQTLSVTVVPDSGTGALVGLTGQMTIRVEAGVHHYGFSFELPPNSAASSAGGVTSS